MELEFDKEIDAILRKGRDTRGVLVGDDPPQPKKHLDADTIAAFAENALPERARVLYTGHFADCNRCRSQLSQAIVMNREADAAAASTASPPVEKPKPEGVPWYSKIFRTPSIALAMGSLVLVLTAALGYLVLQKHSGNAANNAVMSKASEPEADRGSYYTGEPSATNTNDAAPNTSAPAQPYAAAPGTVASASNSSSAAASNEPVKAPLAEEKESEDSRKSNNYVLDGVTTSAPKPAPPAGAGAPPPADQPKTERDEMRAGADDSKDKQLARPDEGARSRMDREAMPEALKKVGPSRAGPLNTQQQTQNNIGEMSVTRHVDGKTFANRNGAWYDTAYSGQSPTLIRRGSDEFKKLDGGLRSIANQLYGTVIIIWKGKAYRIN